MDVKNKYLLNVQSILPLLVVIYLLAGLFAYVFLWGDLQSYTQFLTSDNALAVLAIYIGVGVAGLTATFLLKKDLNVACSPKKLAAACFLGAVVVGAGMFTYLNFTSTPQNFDWMHDGTVYQQLGQSFLANKEFIEPGGHFSHHLGPVFPMYLSPFYAFLPLQLGTQVALEILFCIAVLVVFYTTKQLYGSTLGLITAALATTVPAYVFATSRNYSEPLILIFYTLTIYFVVESLNPKKQRWVIWAGLWAVLGFLVKPSFGYFFIVVGLVGLVWRFRFDGWKILKNKNILAAISVFLAVTAVWTTRNVIRFWDGTFIGFLNAALPSDYMEGATGFSFNNLSHIANFFSEAAIFAVLSAFFMLAYIWFFVGNLKTARQHIQEEKTSFLLIAVVLPVIVAIFASSLFFNLENTTQATYSYLLSNQIRYFNLHTVRYLFVALVPLSWLAFEFSKSREQKNQVVRD